jgi:hypothetical protein
MKREADERHHPLIDDCAGHFKRYMAYQLRVANARAGIAKRELEQTVDDVVEQMDYMMTFQSLYGIETTVKFFGKRGILMHGTEAHFMTTSGHKQTHYFNHIALHDMKQDWKTVLALFESKLRMLKEIQPATKKVRVDVLKTVAFDFQFAAVCRNTPALPPPPSSSHIPGVLAYR